MKPRYKVFRIVDLFAVKNTHSILKSDVSFDNFGVPYVTAGESNNSVFGLVNANDDIIEEGNSIMIGGKTTVVSYQSRDYVSNDSHNLALYLKEEKYRTENIQLFLTAALQKSLRSRYSWGDSISFKKIQNDSIHLPVTTDNYPDYEYMETYIRAQEKLAIKDALNLKDTIIEESKAVVDYA